MEKVKVKVSKILDISNAIESIATVETLDGTTSYWLGRLGDSCTSAVKSFNKQKTKAGREIGNQQNELVKQMDALRESKVPEDVATYRKLQVEVEDLNVKFTEEINNLLELEDDVIKVDLKLKNFTANEDSVRVETLTDTNEKGEKTTRKVEVKIKKGQVLVPVKFFRLMGEYIKE